MNNIFIHKQTNEEVNLIHMGKMKENNETVAIYEVEQDRTMPIRLAPKLTRDNLTAILYRAYNQWRALYRRMEAPIF